MSISYEDSEDIFTATSLGARADIVQRQQYARRLALMGDDIPERLRIRGDLAPFIGWDGEGISRLDGTHDYVLFGASEGSYHCDTADGGISTLECFRLLLRVRRENPAAIHVIFAGSYDANMMFRDLPVEVLERIKADKRAVWQGIRIEYRKSKYLRLTDIKEKLTVTLWDVFTFYSTSFLKAVKEYLGAEYPTLDIIEAGKAKRHDFINADIQRDIIPYWRAELETLVALVGALRRNLTSAGIAIRNWHGPGSVASTLYRNQGYRRSVTPDDVNRAAQYAYAGGRFEQLKVGVHDGPVYQYDIRSAYPAAITRLPALGGEWDHHGSDAPVQEFGLYRVTFDGRSAALPSTPMPLHWRHKNSAVFFPAMVGDGWYWGTEVANLVKYWEGCYEVREAWIYRDTGARPFGWVGEMYERRAQWKREGNPSQLALKLALNSLYGKMAQQVGARYDRKTGTWKLPAYHQLEYAGWVTAYTRSLLYEALMLAPHSAVAVETDAIFSTVPLRLPIADKLGSWESTEYGGIAYVQSGVYFTKDQHGWTGKYRGFNKPCKAGCADHDSCKGALTFDPIRDYLAQIHKAQDAYSVDGVSTTLTRFKTIGSSIGKANWRCWVEERRTVRAGIAGGKREHSEEFCLECMRDRGSLADCLHTMVPALSLRGVDYARSSTPYPLAWKGDPPSEFESDSHDESVYE